MTVLKEGKGINTGAFGQDPAGISGQTAIFDQEAVGVVIAAVIIPFAIHIRLQIILGGEVRAAGCPVIWLVVSPVDEARRNAVIGEIGGVINGEPADFTIVFSSNIDFSSALTGRLAAELNALSKRAA